MRNNLEELIDDHAMTDRVPNIPIRRITYAAAIRPDRRSPKGQGDRVLDLRDGALAAHEVYADECPPFCGRLEKNGAASDLDRHGPRAAGPILLAIVGGNVSRTTGADFPLPLVDAHESQSQMAASLFRYV